MKVSKWEKQPFLELARTQPEELLRRVKEPEVFIIQGFYSPENVRQMRERADVWRKATPPSWHPLHDGCPDYHRLHDNYEKAHVKGRIHTYYYHGWYPHNAEIFEAFRELFELKLALAGDSTASVVQQIPSQGLIARVHVHHYPPGGGYQAEHIDPIASHAKVQTIVQASQFGRDFRSGGVYARVRPGAEKFFIDPLTKPGDLIVMDPGIPHGVAPVDEAENFDWERQDGRWMIMPMLLWSDYPHPENIKPREVTTEQAR